MKVEIKSMPERRLAAVRHTGPYNQIQQAFARLGELADDTPLAHSSAAMLAIWHDDPEAMPPEQLRSHAALVVPEDVPLPVGLEELRLPAGRYALTIHIGPYELLGDVWARFRGEWLRASGLQLGPGMSHELYRNTPATVPKDQLNTELYLPIAG